MLPEKAVLEGVVGGREVGAPMQPLEVEPVLRLSRVAEQAAAAEPPPLLLTVLADAAPRAADAGTWNGAALRHARELRGLTLAKLADSTKVTRHHLENIEGDRYDRLPSYVYLRGILLNVAKELRLDPQQVCRSYLDAARQATGVQ